MAQVVDLSQLAWTVRACGDLTRVPAQVRGAASVGLPATVPGCVHEDLIRAGIIGDPRIGMNEAACSWVGWTDWRYEAAFEVDERELEDGPVELEFDSLDTVCRVELNGAVVGSFASEFVRHPMTVTGQCRRGRNLLAVEFTSPLRHARAEADRLGARPVNGDYPPYNMIRKCASSFEWDWGPRIASCGITGGVRLFSRPREATACQPRTPVARFVHDATTGAVGFSSSGSPMFCLGANWIPQGLFPSERTTEKVRPLLEAARDCGVNMIRVWGGGRYEPDWFYDLCDELGLMVWQDFMFACACYPEEEPVRSLVEREAREQVARLARHPSVVLWCGGNENHWAWRSWGERGEGYRARLKEGQTWGRGYWQEMLPAIVKELDPERAYWPDSPWSGDEALHPNDTSRGDRHSWDVNFWDAWSGGYQKIVPRFCSEFGQQSPSNWATLKEAELVPAGEDVASDGSWSSGLMGSALARRQRGPGGNTRWFDEPLDALFNRPRDFGQWHYAAQLLQARAVRTGIEWHRVNGRPQDVCSGVLVWQLNDAWPGLSWSLIDSAGRKKPAYYAARYAMRPRILSVHLVDGTATVYAVNDTDQPWRTSILGTLQTARGERTRMVLDTQLDLAPRSAARVSAVDVHRVHGPTELLTVRSGDDTADAQFWFGPDRDFESPEPRLRVELAPAAGGLDVSLTSDVVARDVVLAIDRVDPTAECDDQLFTLLPGARKNLRVRTRLPTDELQRVIRSLVLDAGCIGRR